MIELTPLYELARKYGTDKGGCGAGEVLLVGAWP
jgi:hypothetical protein